jgi:CheY-like chemotaxis protein
VGEEESGKAGTSGYDSRLMQALLAGVLGKHGCKVTVAGSGLSACELMVKERFDLVLMSLEMSTMEGRPQ